jgi:hypothetical protein
MCKTLPAELLGFDDQVGRKVADARQRPCADSAAGVFNRAVYVDGGVRVRIEQHPILTFERGRRVAFTYDGQELEGYEGEPIVAALHDNGVRTLRESTVLHRPRGFYCAIGNCSSCLMTVDGEPNVRVCVERLRPGMRVETQSGKGKLGA